MDENNNESVVTRVRFPRYLHEWIKKKAKKEKRSMAQQISFYIDKEYEMDLSEKELQLAKSVREYKPSPKDQKGDTCG